jgi:DNA-binding NarL/FixJ family response regulator
MHTRVTVEAERADSPMGSIRRDGPAPARPIRILIAEDQQFVADALQALLSRQPGMVVAGNVGSVADALPSLVTLLPDVLMLEFRLTDGSPEVIRTIHEGSDAKVILLTHDADERVILAAIELGASAVVNMSTAAIDVVQAVRTVAEGGTLIDPATIASVLNRRRKTDHMRDRLTIRERQVLGLMSQGTSNRAIAAKLGISYTTVRSHLRNVASKLAAHSQLEVLVKAQRLDLVDSQPTTRTSLA